MSRSTDDLLQQPELLYAHSFGLPGMAQKTDQFMCIGGKPSMDSNRLDTISFTIGNRPKGPPNLQHSPHTLSTKSQTLNPKNPRTESLQTALHFSTRSLTSFSAFRWLLLFMSSGGLGGEFSVSRFIEALVPRV